MQTQPYLPAGSPRAAEDVLQLEADPKRWVRDHFAQVDAAPQDQGLTCTPAPGWRSSWGQCPRQEGCGTGSGGSPPYLSPEPGTPGQPPRAASASGTSTATCGAWTKRRPLWTPTCRRRSRTATPSPSGAALACDRQVLQLGQRGGTASLPAPPAARKIQAIHQKLKKRDPPRHVADR